jgi:hypothetical protein
MVTFLFGFMLGLIVAPGSLVLLTFWLCSRGNKLAAARFLNGIASVLADKAKPPPPAAAGDNGQVLPVTSKEGGPRP